MSVVYGPDWPATVRELVEWLNVPEKEVQALIDRGVLTLDGQGRVAVQGAVATYAANLAARTMLAEASRISALQAERADGRWAERREEIDRALREAFAEMLRVHPTLDRFRKKGRNPASTFNLDSLATELRHMVNEGRKNSEHKPLGLKAAKVALNMFLAEAGMS